MKRCAVLTCASFQVEVAQALALEGLDDVVLGVFPSRCGMPSIRIEELLRILPENLGPEAPVHVLGGACLLGGLDPAALPPHWRLHCLSTCHAMLAGDSLCKAKMRTGAYLLSSGWLATWDARMKAWGFTPTTARDFFGESARSLLLLDTGVHPGAARDLQAMADAVGLPAETIPVGLDHLRLFLTTRISAQVHQEEREEVRGEARDLLQQLAAYGAALELVSGFQKVLTERETVERLREVCETLFAPRVWAFLPHSAEGFGALNGPDLSLEERAALEEDLREVRGAYCWTPEQDGFSLRIHSQGETMGVLHLRAFVHPEHARRYLNLAIPLSSVFGLALAGARAQDALTRLNQELESRVRQRTAALQEANDDLEAFCYMISHELRAPLARLQGYSEVIRECIQEQTWPQLDALATRLAASSQDTRTVIDGLLTLTRLSLDELHPEPIDLVELVETWLAVEETKGRRRPDQVQVAGPLPVRADATMLRLALGQLLDNALKFHATENPSLLEVGRIVANDQPVHFVRDRGVGFDSAHAGNLFTPFCRMHAVSEFEGAGLGLAMARKVIERHGGRLWAESTPGAGSTFFFTLPEV